METLKYTTKIRGKNLSIPEHILEKLDADAKVEVVFRPIRHPSSEDKDVDQVIDKIKKQMDKKFPNLVKPINQKLRSIAGISRNIAKEYEQYTDREIIGMGRMEKYLEKGEIIESLF